MEDAKILLTESELNSIKSLQSELQSVVIDLGSIELQINNLNNTKLLTLDKVKQIQAKQNQLGSELNKKYGEGTIDLDSGEFNPNTK